MLPFQQERGISGSGANHVIGGLVAGAANVIGGVDIGIGFSGTSATIQGNFIGVNAAMTRVMNNGIGGRGDRENRVLLA